MARAPPQRERGGKSGQRDNEKEEGGKECRRGPAIPRGRWGRKRGLLILTILLRELKSMQIFCQFNLLGLFLIKILAQEIQAWSLYSRKKKKKKRKPAYL